MIIVKLMGGLGNQMFQYAAGRRLAHVHRTELKLDLSWFAEIAPEHTVRTYELAVFNIQALFATPLEVTHCKGPICSRRFAALLTRLTPRRRKHYIIERHFHFDPTILTLPDNVYLDGYWQCSKYFMDIEGIIRKEFTVLTEPDDANRQAAEAISHGDTVSVHVRRGDYISNPAISHYHGVCTIDYYRKAMESVAARVKHPHFIVFSDDADWVKKNILSTHAITFMDHNGPEKAYEDLRLMSRCRHHIIANSSFSWWGAWLCGDPAKTVVAPSVWFRDPAVNTKDLIPAQWIQI